MLPLALMLLQVTVSRYHLVLTPFQVMDDQPLLALMKNLLTLLKNLQVTDDESPTVKVIVDIAKFGAETDGKARTASGRWLTGQGGKMPTRGRGTAGMTNGLDLVTETIMEDGDIRMVGAGRSKAPVR